MRANWIEATSATGGTGAMTLVDVANRPNFDDVFAGTRLVEYVIEEPDAGKFESGVGSFVASTKVLTRTKRYSTFTAGVYTATAPAAVSFGTTGVTVRCAPVADRAGMWTDVVQAGSSGLSDGFAALATGAASGAGVSAQNITADRYFAQACYWHGGEIAALSMYLHSGATASQGLKVGIYSVGSDGLPGDRLWSNNATPFDAASTGVKRASGIATWRPPGWHYIVVLSSSGTPNWATQIGPVGGPAGVKLCRPITCFYGYGGVYATGLPASAPITSGDLAQTFVDGIYQYAVSLEVG